MNIYLRRYSSETQWQRSTLFQNGSTYFSCIMLDDCGRGKTSTSIPGIISNVAIVFTEKIHRFTKLVNDPTYLCLFYFDDNGSSEVSAEAVRQYVKIHKDHVLGPLEIPDVLHGSWNIDRKLVTELGWNETKIFLFICHWRWSARVPELLVARSSYLDEFSDSL